MPNGCYRNKVHNFLLTKAEQLQLIPICPQVRQPSNSSQHAVVQVYSLRIEAISEHSLCKHRTMYNLGALQQQQGTFTETLGSALVAEQQLHTPPLYRTQRLARSSPYTHSTARQAEHPGNQHQTTMATQHCMLSNPTSVF